MAARLRRADDLQIHPVPNGYVVRRAGSGTPHHLNPLAALLLELCQGEATADELAAGVAGATKVAPAELVKTLDELVGMGLVVSEGDAGAAAPPERSARGPRRPAKAKAPASKTPRAPARTVAPAKTAAKKAPKGKKPAVKKAPAARAAAARTTPRGGRPRSRR